MDQLLPHLPRGSVHFISPSFSLLKDDFISIDLSSNPSFVYSSSEFHLVPFCISISLLRFSVFPFIKAYLKTKQSDSAMAVLNPYFIRASSQGWLLLIAFLLKNGSYLPVSLHVE